MTVMYGHMFFCVTASGGTGLGNPFGSALAPMSQQNQPLTNATLNFFGQQSTANTQQASSGGEQLFCCVCVCVRACVCLCMHVCVCACVRACPFIVLAPCVPHGSVSQMDNTIMVAVTTHCV